MGVGLRWVGLEVQRSQGGCKFEFESKQVETGQPEKHERLRKSFIFASLM